ncbi:MAG: hypothetical protein A2445_05150 [Candidatus Jacksonbacteria bacterium RIFOXYC2_FULL_44_29]|nr:MAG: family 2 glycosyl transferase [Parcubacteria group bacterium GW2011_GWC2_44_22]OGY75731.1 MAG: hypothetical protein A2240_06295 [Candidatus Jacksonbacteria bacterium RIFOXYA2_FULL_43_12]OGY76297.1 MAG: hypothetical protein A2295_00780 [Candidatus Jacksonbacteria bacterium RIFOXYB2_FULL_44_15]OGY78123.1 MAG: hypothetical protein A2445_05150 [Candidatus Jacksonbacteria bacterium RIFOXYC2_FULL_44_29]OGY80968.1 MAG: hypothetical protein A2550_02895 [Candidatus Jacksonbacteria bacterium RIFO
MAKLSIHLVAYNGQKYLPFALKSLQEQSFSDFSVLIIDNGSHDDSVKVVDDFLANPKNKILSAVTKYVKHAKNFGFAGAHNLALHWSQSEYVFLMNQDVTLDRDYLKEIMNFFDNHQEAADATGAIYQWDFPTAETTENSEKIALTDLGKTDRIDSLGLKILANHQVIELLPQHLSTQPWEIQPQKIFGASGALPVYRRRALEECKVPMFNHIPKLFKNQKQENLYEYFDNDFFCYKEDVDLAYRFVILGQQCYLVPKAKSWHDRSAAATGNLIRDRRRKSKFINYHSYKNHIYFLIKNVPPKIWYKHWPKILGYEFFKFGYLLIFEPKTLWQAWSEIIKNWPKMRLKRKYLQTKAGPLAWQTIEPWIR